jgi:hypothetical protein
MIPLIKKFFRNLFFDEMAAARLMRGFLLWLSGMAVSVLAYPMEVVQAWNMKDWGYRMAVAGVMGAAGMITAGQKNPTADQIRTVANEPVGAPPPPGMS